MKISRKDDVEVGMKVSLIVDDSEVFEVKSFEGKDYFWSLKT